jgi:hypothetical protein
MCGIRRLILKLAREVRWRTAARRHGGLEHGIVAVRLLTCRQEAVQVADYG